MELRFESCSGLEREARVVAELTTLRSTLDLEGLEWTDRVIVQAFVLSHSHPVLTVNTLHRGDALLSTYLHEQVHWWLADHPGTLPAIKASTNEFPRVPVRLEDGGSRSEDSTRLHLLVCFLTHAAMTELLGRERADAELDRLIAATMYGWVQRQVKTRPADIRRLCWTHDLWPSRLQPNA